MYLLTRQILQSKVVFWMFFYLSASNTTWRKLPPAQLPSECSTTVVASIKTSTVMSSVKCDVYGCHWKLGFQFLKKVFTVMPDSKRYRNIIFSMSVDWQDITWIDEVQLYSTLALWIMIPVCARRDLPCSKILEVIVQKGLKASDILIAPYFTIQLGKDSLGSQLVICDRGCQCYWTEFETYEYILRG